MSKTLTNCSLDTRKWQESFAKAGKLVECCELKNCPVNQVIVRLLTKFLFLTRVFNRFNICNRNWNLSNFHFPRSLAEKMARLYFKPTQFSHERAIFDYFPSSLGLINLNEFN